MRPIRRRGNGVLLAVALAATSASGCSPYSGNPAARVQQWVTKSVFISNANTIVSDISRIRRAISEGTPKDLRTICAGLVDDVGTTYESLPTPALALTYAINAADQIMFRAANACSAASSVSSASTRHAVTQLSAGESRLRQVQVILGRFGVHWSASL